MWQLWENPVREKQPCLNILAALRPADLWNVFVWMDMELSQIRESKIAEFRRDNLGFVFQDFNLLDTFTLKDNIMPSRWFWLENKYRRDEGRD